MFDRTRLKCWLGKHEGDWKDLAFHPVTYSISHSPLSYVNAKGFGFAQFKRCIHCNHLMDARHDFVPYDKEQRRKWMEENGLTPYTETEEY